MVNFFTFLDTKKAGLSKNGLKIGVPLIFCHLQAIIGKVQEVLTHIYICVCVFRAKISLSLNYTHTHTHIYIYIYTIYVTYTLKSTSIFSKMSTGPVHPRTVRG